MIVTKPDLPVQDILFIPREDAQLVNIIITDESTLQEDVQTNLTASFADGLMTLQIAYDFEEGGGYTIQVDTTTGDLLFRGKIFCTAQLDLENYNQNENLLQA